MSRGSRALHQSAAFVGPRGSRAESGALIYACPLNPHVLYKPQAATELKEQAQRAKDAAATGPSMSLNARSDIVEQTSAQAGEWAYARQVEITNGRWAMLGALRV